MRTRLAAALLLSGAACGGEAPPASLDAGASPDAPDAGGPRLPYAERLVVFDPGEGAGFGADQLPGVVLGAPGAGGAGGSLDVLSLGAGGEIVLGFADGRELVDGPGPDLVVFENAFYAGGDPTQPFAELAEVAVSEDGERWASFACDVSGAGMGRYPGCAGWTPTEEFDPAASVPLDPELSGGDAFDLAAIGVARARLVRIRDLGTNRDPGTAGFDLDAVGLVHFADP